LPTEAVSSSNAVTLSLDRGGEGQQGEVQRIRGLDQNGGLGRGQETARKISSTIKQQQVRPALIFVRKRTRGLKYSEQSGKIFKQFGRRPLGQKKSSSKKAVGGLRPA